MAEQLSGQVALSIAFNPEFESDSNGKRMVRCVELYSADLVSDAAANRDGLFDATPTLTNTATVVPAGHKIKGKSVGAICPTCSAHEGLLSKLAVLHKDAANRLELLCSSLEHISSAPAEQQFQARLNAQRLELQKGLEKKASVMACRMLSATGVKLSKIPDADTCMSSGDSILDRLHAIQDPTEKGAFYQKNKVAIQAAFQRATAKNVQLENQAKGTL